MALKGEVGAGLQKSTREQVLGIALKARDGTVWAVLAKWRWRGDPKGGKKLEDQGGTQTRRLNPVPQGPSSLGPSQPVTDFRA